MGKTVFSAGDQAQGIKGTKVTAVFLNALQSHRHSGADADGACPLDYAVAAGTANAITLALTPALTAAVPGMPIFFKAASTNTAAVTIAVNGLGAVAIKKNFNQPLVAGDIVAGQTAILMYDGANYQMINNGQAVDLSSFAKSLGSNGYQKLPGGLIIQWGSVMTNASGFAAVTFPVAFPVAVLSSTASFSSTGVIANMAVVGANNPSGMNVYLSNTSGTGVAGSVMWLAVGY